MSEENKFWRKCGNCKKEIDYQATYQSCSVSSCRKFVYCCVDCWSVHNSVMNHKSAWAEEHIAPTFEKDKLEEDPNRGRRRILVGQSVGKTSQSGNIPRDILIVAAKLKSYVKIKHNLNTSANVMERLSDMIRIACDHACDKARMDGRKTLMDRDFD